VEVFASRLYVVAHTHRLPSRCRKRVLLLTILLRVAPFARIMERKLCPDFIVMVLSSAMGGKGSPMFGRLMSEAECECGWTWEEKQKHLCAVKGDKVRLVQWVPLRCQSVPSCRPSRRSCRIWYVSTCHRPPIQDTLAPPDSHSISSV
jgi:hypothetical protein